MKIAWIVVATILSIALQSAIARFGFRGTLAVDLVLVVVVYSALSFGPITGLLTGAFAGIAQDALASGVIGIGGISKTVVGFIAGIIGTQFIVSESPSRFVAFFAATCLHSAVFIGIYVLLGLRELGNPYTAVLEQALGNAVVGTLAFRLIELLPGAVERRRAGRHRTRH